MRGFRPQPAPLAAAGDTRPIRVVTEDEIRGTCNRLVWGGINTLTSYYAFKDLTDEQVRAHQHATPAAARQCSGEGRQVTDIAVLYPIESVWPVFWPRRCGARRTSPGAPRRERFRWARGLALYAAGRDFAYVDSQALRELRVAGGALTHGDLRCRVLVLPAADTLPLAAWENVASFWPARGR